MNAKLSLLTEDALTLPQAARELPGKPNPSTLWRWTVRGIGGQKLETIKIGSKVFTTRQALSRFIERTQEPATP